MSMVDHRGLPRPFEAPWFAADVPTGTASPPSGDLRTAPGASRQGLCAVVFCIYCRLNVLLDLSSVVV